MRRSDRGLGGVSPEMIATARDETAATIFKIMLTFVGAALFCVLSLLSPDVSLLSSGQTLTVPFAGPVSFLGFIIVGPTLLITLRIYLQIFVEHSRRLEPISQRLNPVRAPTLIVLRNPLLRAFSGIVLYLLLPLTMIAFTWKAAVLPAWIPGFIGATTAVIAVHVTLPLRWSWLGKISLSLAIAAVVGLSFVYIPLRRPFDLVRVDLSHKWLRAADLTGADLTGANLSGADLVGAQVDGAHLAFADLTGADLYHVHLEGAVLQIAHLQTASFYAARLKGADFTNADLKDADLTDADLTNANLSGAHLAHTRLEVANLTGADLTFADLTDADLTNANLTGAKLRSADLTSANLTGARNLSQKQVDEARGDEKTVLPAGISRPVSWAKQKPGLTNR